MASGGEAEDAPPGHKAFSAIKRLNEDVLCFEKPIRIQMTVRATGGNREHAYRILRLCYVRAEAGAGKEEVEAYKRDLCIKLTGRDPQAKKGPHTANPGASPPKKASEVVPTPKKASEDVPTPKKASEDVPVLALLSMQKTPRSCKREEEEEDSQDEKGLDSSSSAGSDQEEGDTQPQSGKPSSKSSEQDACNGESSVHDAPAGHAAWSAVRKAFTNGIEIAFVLFQPKEPGSEKVRVQVTANATGGNYEEAKRICRLCYVKLDEGASKKEVDGFKKSMCEAAQATAGVTAKPPGPAAVPAGAVSASAAPAGAASAGVGSAAAAPARTAPAASASPAASAATPKAVAAATPTGSASAAASAVIPKTGAATPPADSSSAASSAGTPKTGAAKASASSTSAAASAVTPKTGAATPPAGSTSAASSTWTPKTGAAKASATSTSAASKPAAAKAVSDKLKRGMLKPMKRKQVIEPPASSWKKLRRIRKLEDMSDDQLRASAALIARHLAKRDSAFFVGWSRVGLLAHDAAEQTS